MVLGACFVVWGLRDAVAGEQGRSALDAARKTALGTAEAVERLAAANRVTRLGSDPALRTDAVHTLVHLLRDRAAPLRRAAANGLSRLDATEAAPALRTRLGLETNVQVRPALLLALGRLGAAEDVPRLIGFVRHTVPAVRAAAVMALGARGGEAARLAVRQTLLDTRVPDPGWVIRASVFVALAQIGTADDVPRAQRIYVAFEGYRHFLARSAWVRLVSAKAAEPRTLLLDFLADPDSRVAITAAKGLAQRGHAADLISALDDPEDADRRAAAAIGLATIPGDTVRLRLVRQVQRDPSRRVRWTCARLLFERKDPEGDELILRGLRAREPAVWAEAMALLEERTGEKHERDVAAWQRALARVGKSR